MLALGIEFLTGRYVATAYNDRRRAEWPPHPARVFSALVATHFEDPERDPREREALEWLERQPPPEIHGTPARIREVVDVFVPVNDPSVIGDAWREFDEVEAARTVVGEATEPKAVAKARKVLEKAEAKLASKVAKAVAPVEGKLPAETRKMGVSLLPEHRGKQARTFPSVVPDEPRVTLVWREIAIGPDLIAALDKLAARVVRIGHSSSLVSMRVVPKEQVVERPYRVPDAEGDEVLRGVEAGQFERLCEDFERHQAREPRVMPAAMHLYRPAAPPRPTMAASVFGEDWIVFEQVAGPRLPASRCVDMARAVRGALQKHADQPPPEIISGHKAQGVPSERDHLAIVPLPVVGHRHADGNLRGVALVLPRDASAAERNAVLRAVGAWERHERGEEDVDAKVPVRLPGGLEVHIGRVIAADLDVLRSSRWCRPARRWATVTPIALDRHPGDLWARDPRVLAKAIAEAEATVIAACERIGLPPPRVEVHPASPIAGGRKARDFPAYPPVPGRTRRVLTHAVLEFEHEVAGPLLLGAARYHGLGLLVPLPGGPR